MSRKQIFIALGVVLVLVLGGLTWFLMGDSGGGGTVSASGYTLQPTDRTLGNPKSKVVLIEYGAPSCPVCAAFNVTGFPQIKAKYIDTGKINYVFRVFPLRPDTLDHWGAEWDPRMAATGEIEQAPESALTPTNVR